MFITTLKDVRNIHTNQVGDMKFIAYKYDKESRKTRQGSENHYGLVIFHRDEYIKSFVLTFEQVKLCTHKNLFLLDDIGFILRAYYMDMSIYDLGSYAVNNTNKVKNNCLVDYVGKYEFVLDRGNDELLERVTLDYKETGYAGFRKAIHQALCNPNESDFLVPHLLPEEEEIEFERIIDYSKDI